MAGNLIVAILIAATTAHSTGKFPAPDDVAPHSGSGPMGQMTQLFRLDPCFSAFRA